jgi:hypothetical protein
VQVLIVESGIVYTNQRRAVFRAQRWGSSKFITAFLECTPLEGIRDIRGLREMDHHYPRPGSIVHYRGRRFHVEVGKVAGLDMFEDRITVALELRGERYERHHLLGTSLRIRV